jgi:hypothetical protein
MRAVIAVLMGAVLATACDKSKPTPDAESGAKADVAKTAATREEAPKAMAKHPELPTEEDFEEAVQAELTEQTDIDKELDQLEKDISQ